MKLLYWGQISSSVNCLSLLWFFVLICCFYVTIKQILLNLGKLESEFLLIDVSFTFDIIEYRLRLEDVKGRPLSKQEKKIFMLVRLY